MEYKEFENIFYNELKKRVWGWGGPDSEFYVRKSIKDLYDIIESDILTEKEVIKLVNAYSIAFRTGANVHDGECV